MSQPHRPVPVHHPRRRTRSRPAGVRKRKAVKPTAKPQTATRDSSVNALSSINLVNLLDSFYTIRSTIKDLRVSLEKLDNTMDSAYQMFEIAQTFIRQQPTSRRRSRLQLLPPPNSRRSQQPMQDDSEKEKSRDTDGAPLSDLFENIDMGQIMGILQSPLVQNFINQLSQNSHSGPDESARHAKEG